MGLCDALASDYHYPSLWRAALFLEEAGKTIAVLGLTFKPETDDMRDSPSLAIIPNLIDKGATILAHDPQGMEEAKKLLPDQVNYFRDDQINAMIDAATEID